MDCKLPEDVLHDICAHCSSDTLTRCALVNSILGDIAQRRLYRSLYLNTTPPQSQAQRLVLSSPSGLQYTRSLTACGITAEGISGLFYRLAQFSQLRHLSYVVTAYFEDATPAFVASFCALIALPSLQSLRMVIATDPSKLQDAMLVALFSCPILTDLQLSTTCPILVSKSFTLRHSSLAKLQTLRIKGFATEGILDTDEWAVTRPFLNLTELTSLEVAYDNDLVTPARNFQAITSCVKDIPLTIENLALAVTIDAILYDPLDAYPYTLPPMEAFTLFQCLRTLSIRLTAFDAPLSLVIHDLIPHIIANISPKAPIHTIQIQIDQEGEATSFPDNVLPDLALAPCWKQIRENMPKASLLMYIPESPRPQPLPPFPDFNRVIQYDKAESVLWPFGLLKRDE